MAADASLETHHGALLNISGQGVFIVGDAGIGKSSLALELLHQGHQLIADDIVEFAIINQDIIGHCPILLSDLLHTRELGLIPVTQHFGTKAWQATMKLDLVIRLVENNTTEFDGLKPSLSNTLICRQMLPTLTLSTQTPASLVHRIKTWLAIQTGMSQTEAQFKQKQQHLMTSQLSP